MLPSKWTKWDCTCYLSLYESWSHLCFATAHTIFPILVSFSLYVFSQSKLDPDLPLMSSSSPSFLLFCSASTSVIWLFLWNIFQLITKISDMCLQWECSDWKGEILNMARRRGSGIGQCEDHPRCGDSGLQVTRAVQEAIQVLFWIVNSHQSYPILIKVWIMLILVSVIIESILWICCTLIGDKSIIEEYFLYILISPGTFPHSFQQMGSSANKGAFL